MNHDPTNTASAFFNTLLGWITSLIEAMPGWFTAGFIGLERDHLANLGLLVHEMGDSSDGTLGT